MYFHEYVLGLVSLFPSTAFLPCTPRDPASVAAGQLSAFLLYSRFPSRRWPHVDPFFLFFFLMTRTHSANAASEPNHRDMPVAKRVAW